MITLASLTDGALGAVLGAAAVFFAAVFTLRRTRIGEERREHSMRRDEDARLRRQYVAEVISTLRELEREMRMAPLLVGRAQAAFMRATMLFYMAEVVDHPAVARWLLAQQPIFNEMNAVWRRMWWCPVMGRRRRARVGTYLGEVIGALVLWATGEIADDKFADPKLPPRQLAAGSR